MSESTPPLVVVDTNVLVSATILPHGNPNRLLTAWEQGAFRLLVSDELIAEVEQVLHRDRIRRKYQLTSERIDQLIGTLQTAATRVMPRDPIPLSSRDPDDDKLLAIAIAGNAHYLVTGDDDLLTLDGDPALGPLRILTVRDFLGLLAPQPLE